ncbi:hypothetical protein [Rhizobium sp. BK176]|uniref:hypothetical protein n=1 Tax=Rhizobium sp. BK176 TaxID=2587071 RepID=UPI002167C3F2|nr:hypothetical protein [Rhizobium sp. BK176]
MSYVDERLAEIRATMHPDDSSFLPPKAKYVRTRTKRARKVDPVIPAIVTLGSEPTPLERFDALAGQLRQEDEELTEL